MNILEKKTNIKDSYVKNKNWNKDIAYKIAEKEKIILKKEHWLIIIQLRKFYIKYKISPEINLFISFIKKKYRLEIGNLKYINFLFKNKTNLIYKISEVPIPKKCLL